MSLVSLHRAEAEPARHRRDEPAAAPRGEPAGARLRRRWRRSATSSKLHRRQVPVAASSTSPTRWPGARRRSRRASPACARRPRTRCAPATRIIIISDRKMDRAARRDSRAARAVGDPPASHRQGAAHLHRPRGRNRVGARGASLRAARRLRRRGGAPVSRLRDAPRAANGPRARGPGRRKSLQELHQGDRQGPAQGDVQDGHLDLHVLHRRADLRGGRPARSAGREVLHRHHVQRRGHRRVRGRRGGDAHPPRGVRRRSGARRARSTRAASTRTACAAKSTCGRPTRSPSCSTRRARSSFATYKEYAQIINDQSRRHMTFRGLFEFRFDRCTAGPDRGGRAGRRDRQALLDRRDVARLDLDRGAHHARDRDEPHRRQVEHRRGRRGPQALRADQGRRDAGRRASAATASSATSSSRQGDSLKSKIKQVASGRFGVTAEYLASRRADPDQDGAGRQARRGRPAARPQGVRVHRRAALLHARAWS